MRTTVELQLPPRHPKQNQIYNDPHRFIVISAGRRFGKTMLGSDILTEMAIDQKHVWWVAPSYQIAEIGWRELLMYSGQVPFAKVFKGDRMINYYDGWVQVRSADAEGGLRGEGLDYILMDEAAHTRNLMNIWEQELRPALSDRRGGAMFISTPKGYNDFYELWKRGDSDKDWASWQVPSWENPYLHPDEIESARQSLPSLVFRQEFGAEFVQLAGAMFRREYFEIIDTAPMLSNVVRFWDLAASKKTLADYTAGCKLGMDSNGTVFILDVIRARYEWPELLRVFRNIALQDGSDIKQGVETAGTQKGFLDMLLVEPLLAGLSITGHTPTADKVTRAQPLLARAEQGKVKIVRGKWNNDLIDELCAFPETDHDDQVDAVTGALGMIAGNIAPRIRIL